MFANSKFSMSTSPSTMSLCNAALSTFPQGFVLVSFANMGAEVTEGGEDVFFVRFVVCLFCWLSPVFSHASPQLTCLFFTSLLLSSFLSLLLHFWKHMEKRMSDERAKLAVGCQGLSLAEIMQNK